MLLPLKIKKNLKSLLALIFLFALLMNQKTMAHSDRTSTDPASDLSSSSTAGAAPGQRSDQSCRSVFVKHTYTLGGDIYSVKVDREDGQTIEYARTNRGVFDLYLHLGANVLGLKQLEGKRILDVGTGDGQFVEDLRSYGIEAEGVDITLNKKQKEKSYFFERDMAHTGLPSATYDTVFSIWTTLTYESEKQNLFRTIVSELKRILKPGGRLVIFPMHSQLIISKSQSKTNYRREFDHRRNQISVRPKGKIFYDTQNPFGEKVYPSYFAIRNLTTLANLGFTVQVVRDRQITTYDHLIVIATKNPITATPSLTSSDPQP
jgi:SAM-dependent methyltransferase